MASPHSIPTEASVLQRRRTELLVFGVLAVLVWPVAAVGVVGGWGLTVWMYQQVYGPPGPAHR